MSDAVTNTSATLNRLSWLRTSPAFLNALVARPEARFLAFQSGAPLAAIRSPVDTRLAALSSADIEALLGHKSDLVFGQGQHEGEPAPEGAKVLEAARLRGAPLVFLGVQESAPNDFGASADADHAKAARELKGTPYFSIDVSGAEQSTIDELVQRATKEHEGAQVSFADARSATRGMGGFDLAMFAEARSMIDWNARNKFCSACGAPHYSAWAGWKLTCSTLLPWADNTGRTPCLTEKGLHNISHPRTDSVVVMTIVNEENDKILLARNRNFPPKLYSALSGFIEPGESFEDAVKREILEEAGIHVWNVRYHSSKPFPYPSSLLVGFFATADPSEPVRTDLDNELSDAKWYTREEVLKVLAHPQSTNLMHQVGSEAADGVDEPLFKIPPPNVPAGAMIPDWAHGRFPPK